MYLLDTNVVSELRKARSGKADKNVAIWADSVDTASGAPRPRAGRPAQRLAKQSRAARLHQPSLTGRHSSRAAQRETSCARPPPRPRRTHRRHGARPWHDARHAKCVRFRRDRRSHSQSLECWIIPPTGPEPPPTLATAHFNLRQQSRERRRPDVGGAVAPAIGLVSPVSSPTTSPQTAPTTAVTQPDPR